MSYCLCIGETLIDFIAQAGIGDVGASEFFQRAAGGAVSNVAVGIARLGGDARFCGALSHDSFGRFLLRTLAHENVGVDGVRLVDAATTLAFVARGDQGQRDFVFLRNPGADSLLASADVDDDAVAHARALHFGGVLLASEPARTTCLQAARTAHAHGVLVSFDPNARPALFSSADDMIGALREGCKLASVLKLSEEDLSALGISPKDLMTLFNEVTEAIVVTNGPAPVHWFLRSGDAGSVTPPKVTVVDTTGAGDAMMAALLWRLIWTHGNRLNAASLSDAVRYGCAAAAYKCQHEGAIRSMPRMEQLGDLLAQVATG